MDFIKRAGLYLRQKIGRTALITLVMSAIMIFVLAGIIIQSAAIQATNSAKNSAGTTVTLSADREKAFASMRKSQSSSSSSSSSSSNAAPAAITMPSVKIKTAEKIAALSNVAGYQYSNSASVNASGFSAVTTSSSSGGGQGGFSGSSNSGDITISGVSTTAAETNFKSKSYKITSGRGITAADKNTNNVVIESELATSNSLKVGSTIKVKTTDDDSKTYTLNVVGIYKAKTSTSSQGGPNMSDPSNTIYSSYTFAGTVNGDTTSVTSVVYTLTDSSKEKAFTKQAKKLISSSFSLTSSSETYALLMKPMKNVQSFANKIVWIVGIAGTIILALITVLMIRERRHEIGVLMALGESKFKIVLQLFSELFAVLVLSLVIAGVAGNFVGNAVGKQLVSQQTTATQSTSTGAGFGGGGQQPGGGGGTAPSGAGRSGQTSMTASGSQVSTLKTKISAKSMAELGGLGLGIIAIAVVAGSTPIFRLKPKKILSNE
ncbi:MULTISPECIES: ABC transporter permease [Leuconostoc]|uniref:FtsX-like permease family protein n=1 Tax=Leuconostoc suionicum TaxID=1511761 RepID=A0A2N9KAT5_9LACO|nr:MULTISPECIES: ABC transporter permease [Leuconostoc]API71693.1 peptide ABC transporter permease [Leuconostoc suionicum]MBE4727131.1 ABC transporter permease [Leuconostoc suionicum]MBS1007678.1 ABC transporter permease [Leuconostoc suionicum]MCT4376329.1 ABC transporter permease [Leuconostoc suionicum]MCT4402442.1 ABC transporter permease [Leuconostoc suionicum]